MEKYGSPLREIKREDCATAYPTHSLTPASASIGKSVDASKIFTS